MDRAAGVGESSGVFATCSAGFVLLQLVLAPQATFDFLGALTLNEVGAVRSISRMRSRQRSGLYSSCLGPH